MKLAILSDIHGNLPALEAIYKDLKKEKVDAVIFLGDLVFSGLFPQECFDILTDLNPSCCIKGNTDANIEEFNKFIPTNSIEEKILKISRETDEKLNKKSKEIIKSWPISKRLNFKNFESIACHGSPLNFKEAINSKMSNFENVKKKLIKENISFLFCGHTHIAEIICFNNITLVNPGGIGYSLDYDNRASYAIITLKNNNFFYQIKKIDYNINYYIQLIENNPLYGKEFAYILKNGMYNKGK